MRTYEVKVTQTYLVDAENSTDARYKVQKMNWGERWKEILGTSGLRWKRMGLPKIRRFKPTYKNVTYLKGS